MQRRLPVFGQLVYFGASQELRAQSAGKAPDLQEGAGEMGQCGASTRLRTVISDPA